MKKIFKSKLCVEKLKKIKYFTTSEEPFIVQYVPLAVILKAKVEMYYEHDKNNEPIEICEDFKPIIIIEDSKDFSALRSVQSVEWATTSTTFLIALISGLLMFHVDNLTFGTLKDYITLFLWGVALDQTKNIMQSLNIKPPTGANIFGK